MKHLATRKLVLDEVPDILANEFESFVIEHYMEHRLSNLMDLTNNVDYFGIFSYSYFEYGDPYYTSDKQLLLPEEESIIRGESYDAIRSDVQSILNFYYLFHTEYDPYDCKCLRELHGMSCYNHPNIEVW